MAQETLLGKLHVTDKVDHDVLRVTRVRGTFTALKLKVHDRAVEFRDLKVHFANGDTQDVELRRVISAGGESRVIELRGDDRVIRTIELRYDAQSLGGKGAEVEVLGRR